MQFLQLFGARGYEECRSSGGAYVRMLLVRSRAIEPCTYRRLNCVAHYGSIAATGTSGRGLELLQARLDVREEARRGEAVKEPVIGGH